MSDERFNYLNHTSVEGLDLVFKVLCLIAKIMIYRLPQRNSIEEYHIDEFKEELKELEG